MANVEQTNGALDVSQAINKQIATKIKYLQELETAVDHHDDCKVYQLLDNQRYAAEIEHREQQPNEQGVMNLVDDLADQLSNFLSANLIQYLGKAYPFFYYEEYQTGHYRIYFGNWWDRRRFGELDVLNIRFAFDQEEYQKLAELQSQLKDASAHSGLFESNKNREARQIIVEQISKLEDEEQESRTAADTIKENERVVLDLSKENTILSYEQKSIVDTFGTFEDFELANRNLYASYLKSLGGKQAGVSADEQ